MKSGNTTIRRAFSLIELVITVVASLVIFLAASVLIVDSQKGYNKMFDRTLGEVAVDSEVARRTFETIVRKASQSRSLLDIDGQFVEVYYYDSFSSTKPDKYANFYLNGSELMVDYGDYDWDDKSTNLESTITLARNVTAATFSVHNVSVQMILTVDDNGQQVTVTSSAVRHN